MLARWPAGGGVYVESVQVIWASHAPPLMWEAHARCWVDPRASEPLTLRPDPLAWEEWDMGSTREHAPDEASLQGGLARSSLSAPDLAALGSATRGSGGEGAAAGARKQPVLYVNTNLRTSTWLKPAPPLFPSMPGGCPPRPARRACLGLIAVGTECGFGDAASLKTSHADACLSNVSHACASCI